MSVLKEKAQVVMLFTKEKSNLHLLKNELGYTENKAFNPLVKPQHLYVISNEEIKEGDWCIHTSHDISTLIKIKYIEDCGKHIMTECGQNCWRDYCKKIIATTDTSLRINYQNHPKFHTTFLPQPSQGFIEKYVKKYNKGNIITDILVDYEEVLIENPNSDGCAMPYYKKQLKVSKDNTITIHSIKNSWSREEVVELIAQAIAESHDWSRKNNDIHSIGVIERRFLKKWIEKNLQII